VPGHHSSVTGTTIISGGAGYTAPVVTITDAAGTPAITATATAAFDPVTGAITVITVTTPGAGYTAPVVTITGGGTGASATTIGAVDSLALLTPGAHYTAPVVGFSGGGGAGAAATTTGAVDSLTLTSPGSGYTSAPTVAFSGGGGAGAAATATIASTGLVLLSGGSGYTSAPTVVISDTPPGTGSGATAYATLSINSVTLINPGSGYTSVPAVTITDTLGGAGTGATAVANMVGSTPISVTALQTAVPSLFATRQNKMIVPEPAFPVGNGHSAQPTYARIQDTSITGWFGGPVAGLTLTTGGSGYASAPSVSITGGGGSGATASLTFFGAFVNGLTLVSGGSGYSSAPTVTFTGGGGTGASATAIFSGTVSSVAVTAGGSGYNRMPAVTFTGGGGTGAAAAATGAVNAIAVTNGGSGYTSAPSVSLSAPPAGGIRATATATINPTTRRVTSVTITNPGSGYTTAPTVTFTGGGGTGARATATLRVTAVNVTNGGSNYTTPPVVGFNNTGTGGSGAAATATLSGSVISLLLTNVGSGYASAPTVGFAGGGGTGAAATATILPGTVASLTLTNGGTGYTSAPTVSFSGGGTPTTPAAAVANPPVNQLLPKAIQELFTLDYGRMNATLGVEIPFTNFFVQTTIPYGYIDPPTELLKDGEIQFWKITHNGVDTHFIHFHLFDVQVINRVGWDGMIKPPDVNEVGWKDTVRMNPLEDIIVALRPMKQKLPWELPNSIRPLDVTEPIGASNPANSPGFANIDPTNQPAVVTNDLTNFGWEYVVHCHILGHEENDMMRPVLLAIPPDPPDLVTATRVGSGNSQSVVVTWVDRSINETGFTVQRATSLTGPWLSLTPAAPAAPGTGMTVSYTDATIARRTSYYYRVVANNVVGYVQTYAAPAVGYPTLSADSVPVNANTGAPVTILAATTVGPIFADSFETGLARWSGAVGNVGVITQAVIGPYGGALGMMAPLGSRPAYVYDTSPNDETMYDANFAFNARRATTGPEPVDIFIGLDQSGQPTFGVQYQSEYTDTFKLRGWAMQNGERVFTPWDTITLPPVEPEEDDIPNTTHKIDVAWLSGTNGVLSLYVDDVFFATLFGDTSAYKLDEVLLGPTMGLTAGASGTLYFDEFTSSRLNGVQYFSLYLPAVYK